MRKVGRKNWFLRIALLIGVIALFNIKFIYTIIKNNDSISDSEVSEYRNVFNKDARRELKFISTRTSKERAPESIYLYKGTYQIFVFRTRLFKPFKMDGLINIKRTISHLDQTEVYALFRFNNFNLDKRASESTEIRHIDLKIEGDSIKKIAANDTVVSYYSNFKSFSVSFNDEPNMLFAQADVSTPFCIEFKKRGGSLYTIILANDTNSTLSPACLNTITN